MAQVAVQEIVPLERIASRIWMMRGKKVMLDFDLAELYGVPTKVLNQAVTRNASRFPEDFLFLLNPVEIEALDRTDGNRSRFVTGSQKHRDPRHPPRAFTQEGVAMLSGVLRSDRAVEMNIAIMRTFVRLRETLATNETLARKLSQHDQQIGVLMNQVQGLLAAPAPKKTRRIGFTGSG